MAPGICTDVGVAAMCSAAGVDVVLILAEGAWFDTGRAGAERDVVSADRGAGGAGPGRVAIFVVGGGEEPDPSAVAAMGAELFGPSGP